MANSLEDLEVIIPWFPSLPDRDHWRTRALRKCLSLYRGAGLLPVVATCSAERFCKADAVNHALERSRASWVAVADADVWAPALVPAALTVMASHPWGRPHDIVHRMNKQATLDCFELGFFSTENLSQKPYHGIDGGGVLIVKREDLLDIPFDARFVGWGGEDASLGYALHTLIGPPYVENQPLFHMWHFAQERDSRQVGNKANEKLRRKYLSCAGRPTQMRQIVEEGKKWQ